MITSKELIWIIVSIIIFEFIVFFPRNNTLNLKLLLVPIIIVLASISAKKYFSRHFNIRIEHKIWEIQQYGWQRQAHFKKPFPIGLIFPLIISILSYGLLKPLTLLQFDAENILEKRLLRKQGHYRKTEINESDLAHTSMAGFYCLFLLSIFAALLNYSDLSKYAIIYGFWNLIPYGNLDGAKVFFGSFFNWIMLAIIFIISLIIVLV